MNFHSKGLRCGSLLDFGFQLVDEYRKVRTPHHLQGWAILELRREFLIN
jgi:hypothetical protein